MNQRMLATLVGLTLFAACTSDSTGSGGNDTSVAPTIVATTTTVPVALTLRNDGLGSFNFGALPENVIAAVTAQFGAPVSDEMHSYPNDNGAGYFHDADSRFAYRFSTGRTVCWSNGFCAGFGGPAAASFTFTGWRYDGDATSTMTTSTGLILGSRLSEHSEIVEALYPCYNDDTGGYDGLTWFGDEQPVLLVVLRSEGIPFTMVAGATDSSPGPIAPADQLFVKRLAAGSYRVSIISQCA